MIVHGEYTVRTDERDIPHNFFRPCFDLVSVGRGVRINSFYLSALIYKINFKVFVALAFKTQFGETLAIAYGF